MNKLHLTTGSFLFCYLAVEEEQNSSNAGKRATEDGEETSLKQSALLCCFTPTLFHVAANADGQKLVDKIMMILHPKMLLFLFSETAGGNGKCLVYSPRSFESLRRTPVYML